MSKELLKYDKLCIVCENGQTTVYINGERQQAICGVEFTHYVGELPKLKTERMIGLKPWRKKQ